ncbi:MAG: regulatory protein RecX [Flavobacteriaceae bacterium]
MQKQRVFTLDEAKKKLEHYCAYQERCHQEVMLKLREMKMIPSAIDTIVGHLIEHNYLNETRFAQSFSRGKFRIKKWGREKILRELKLRQISPYNIKLALKEIPEDEYQRTLEELAAKFWKTNASRDKQVQKKKVYNALRYRGWENEFIFSEIQRLERDL